MLISVVVPVYKVEKYLNRCVDSILNQTFTDFELILVDDGSPDNCGKICDDYAKRDNRVNVIHKQNGGLSEARNYGIEWALKNSNSEWITFIDSDDWVHPLFLELLLDAVVKNNVNLGICDYLSTKADELEEKEINNRVELFSTEDFWTQYDGNSIVAWGKIYKKQDFSDIRYPVGKLHEDAFTTYKIFFKYKEIAYVNEKIYYYYFNPNGIMQSSWTPKRIDELDGHRAIIRFFDDIKKENLKKFEIKKLILLTCNHISLVKNSPCIVSKQKYVHILRKKTLKYFKKFGKELGLSLKKDAWIYECMYPRRMNFYWIIKSQINKFSKVFRDVHN